MATMQDREFVTDMEKAKLDIDPLSGEDVQKIVVDTVETPPELIERAKRYVQH